MNFSDIPKNPDSRTLRQFSWLCIVFFGALVCSQYFRSGNTATATVLATIAVGVGLAGLSSPRLLKPVFVGWMILVFPIGWLVSHLILVLVFWGIFLPVGLVLRISGHDPLRLKKPKGTTYWENKTQQTNLRRYLKQF
jgi:hypothetical protein